MSTFWCVSLRTEDRLGLPTAFRAAIQDCSLQRDTQHSAQTQQLEGGGRWSLRATSLFTIYRVTSFASNTLLGRLNANTLTRRSCRARDTRCAHPSPVSAPPAHSPPAPDSHPLVCWVL
jgi:hypothetical protein